MSVDASSRRDVRAKVELDFSQIPEGEFEPDRELLIGVVRDGEILSSQKVVPGKQKNRAKFTVSVDLPSEDGAAGANVVVAPADDERNLLSDKAASAFISGSGKAIQGKLTIHPGIYQWWRFCWFPHTYRVSGRVVKHVDGCAHPVGAAQVELYDVDYCWWWYSESLVVTTTTDPNGFFDVTFTWCVPLWCLFGPPWPPILIDPELLRRLREVVAIQFPIPPPPPDGPIVEWPPIPPDPIAWEKFLTQQGVELPGRTSGVSLDAPTFGSAPARARLGGAAELSSGAVKSSLSWQDLFGHIIRWPCPDPCDWLPDIRIRVKQTQPSGTVEIYADSYWQIHWDLSGDLLNLTLEANDQALYGPACVPDPILGNCMLFERVGSFNVSTIYEPNVGPGEPYGATPDRSARLGRTADYDRAWCLTPGIHGDFGLAANVDYYQVQIAPWTAGDLSAWSLDNTHRPPDTSFAPLIPPAAVGFTRLYAVEWFGFYVWHAEGFAPATVGGIPALYKSRRKFEQEYVAANGVPAPDFASGWYWDTTAMTRLFDLDTTQLTDGLYTFRIIGYQQTGVDGGGQPVLAEVDMGLTDGACRRCGNDIVPELLTLLVRNQPRQPNCSIDAIKKNGVPVAECDIVVLDTTDSLEVDFTVSDPRGELDQYALSIQRGSDAPQNALTLSGPWPNPTTYGAVIAATPSAAPVWTGGSYSVSIGEAAIAALGGSCAYVVNLNSYDRQTDGYSVDFSAVWCWKESAFTVILAADRDTYCAQLGCPVEHHHPVG